jgi:flagellar biosynthesis/type III secretory pathway chaperone
MDTQELIQILEVMTKNYRQLLELVRKEKEILIKAQPEAIQECQNQKEILIKEISELDTKRLEVVQRIARDLNLANDEIRLLEIAKRIPVVLGDKLRSQHAALDLLLKRLSEINKQNEAVAEMALANVNFALNNIKETLMGQKTYQNKGQ